VPALADAAVSVVGGDRYTAETRARIQELLDAGHAIPDLARALGKTPVSLRRTLTRSSVTAHTTAAVNDLFEALRPHSRETGRRESRIAAGKTGSGEDTPKTVVSLKQAGSPDVIDQQLNFLVDEITKGRTE
jgi:transposase-like protein